MKHTLDTFYKSKEWVSLVGTIRLQRINAQGDLICEYCGERVSNGLPGQTVKGRDCNTEEGGCFGNAEAPDDDHCNPAHVWNFSFPVYP